MGKATRNRVQIGVANVENGTATYTRGTIADRDRDIVHPPASASEGGAALYARVSSADLAAPTAHGWSGMPRSSPLPVPDKGTACDLPSITGEIPICESSLELFE